MAAPENSGSQAETPAGIRPGNWLHAAARWFLRPSPASNGPERRRARFLSILLVCLVVLLALALAATLVFETQNDPRRNGYIVLTGGMLAALLAAIAFNRSGRYQAAVHLTMTCAVLGPWLAILLDSNILHGDYAPPLFLGLSVMLASILLPDRVTVGLAVVQVAGYLVVMSISPSVHQNRPSLVIFMLALSFISVITSILTRDDMRQIEEQNKLLVEREAQLRELSVRDSLTGLFNRRYLEETLERELRRAERKQQSVGVIMIDIDHFKTINDRYGHGAGDAALVTLGKMFKGAVRGGDIVCRYGGEEFIFMLPEASLQVTLQRAEQLRQQAMQTRLTWEGRTLSGLTLSLGVAAYPECGQSGAALIAAADQALYAAKRTGRNRVEPALQPEP